MKENLVLPLSIPRLIQELQNLSPHFDVTEGLLSDAVERGYDCNQDISDLKKNQIECQLLCEILADKLNKLIILQHEVLFKFYPKLARDFDKREYEALTSESVLLPVGHLVNQQQIDERKIKEFDKNFKPANEMGAEATYDFLVANLFIKKGNKETLVKLFKLEPISSNEKIIWIEQSKVGPALRPLVRLVINLILSKHPRKHEKKHYGIFISHYFKTPTGEFNSRSLDTVVSSISNNEDKLITNDRESMIEDFTLSLP